MNSTLTKSDTSKIIVHTVFSELFSSCVEKIVYICEHIVKILLMADYVVVCMSVVCKCMNRTNENITTSDNDVSQYQPI